jgi:hypothetical protein
MGPISSAKKSNSLDIQGATLLLIQNVVLFKPFSLDIQGASARTAACCATLFLGTTFSRYCG